ncbi:MAG: phage minor head protein [Aeromonas sp.]
MASVEKPFIAAIITEKNRYIRQAAKSFVLTQQLTQANFDEHAAFMQAICNKYLTVAIRAATGDVLEAVNGKAEAKDAWQALWVYLVQKWLGEHAARMARETATTTRNDMQRIIDLAFAELDDFNPAAVATRLLTARAISRARAETIAQTEVHNAMMFASQGSAEKLQRDNGITMLKRWVPVVDERTRVNHASMAGQKAIPLDADFIVGGERMARPGDPRGSAANTIRCRCVLAYEVLE